MMLMIAPAILSVTGITNKEVKDNEKKIIEIYDEKTEDESSIVLGPKFIPKGPRIDGKIRMDEWINADTTEFEILDSFGLARVMEGNIYVVNDLSSLYIGIKIKSQNQAFSAEPYLGINIVFDNKHDGQLNNGDNSFFVGYVGDSNDYFYRGGHLINDLDDGGKENGKGAADIWQTFPFGVEQHFEIEFPLNTDDDNHDFSLSFGDTVGFTLSYTYQNNLLENFWWPADIHNTGSWGDIVIASPPELTDSHINLNVARIEVTQSIQNPKNEMPMVKYKTTAVRVHINVDNPNTPGIWPKNVEVCLYGDDYDLDGYLKTTLDVWDSSIPNDLDSTANFILPDTWSSRKRLQISAKIRLIDELETNLNDNWLDLEPINFYSTYVPTIYYIRINNGTESNPIRLSDSYVKGHMEWMENVFPVSAINYVELNWRRVDTKCGNINFCKDIYEELNRIYSTVTGVNQEDFIDEYDQIIGFLEDSGGTAWKGVSAVTGPRNTGGNSGMAHEICHNWGNFFSDAETCLNPIQGWGNHVTSRSCCDDPSVCPDDEPKYGFLPSQGYSKAANCGDPIWQSLYFDDSIHGHGIYMDEFPNNPDCFIYSSKPELMSYNREFTNDWSYKWISTYRWPRILAFLQVTGMNKGNLINISTSNSNDYFMISGWVSKDNVLGYLDPVFSINNIKETQKEDGEYEIVLQDINGEQLTKKGFDPIFKDSDGNINDKDYFLIIAPYFENLYRVLLKYNDIILDEIKISPKKPIVQVISPNGGEYWDDNELIKWTAEDNDDDDLTFMVFYSNDEGETWDLISPYIKETSFTADSKFLSGSKNALIRVVASDGLNIAEDVSDNTFSVASKAPKAWIICPSDNLSNWHEDDVILFRGQGSDIEDVILSNESYRWTSDINGFLGTGRTITSQLLPGFHTITLTVTDSDGNKVKNYVTVNVEADDEIVIDTRDGLGSKTIITNYGDESFVNLKWRIELKGLVFSGTSSSGTIPNIASGESISISPNLPFGFGAVEIYVTVTLPEGEIIHLENGFMIGPFVIKVKDY